MAYILCKVKRADVPYYIENVGLNIYSIEELCYYMVHNIYLLDETIIGEGLVFWLGDELGLHALAEKLYTLLDDKELPLGEFILPIFREINYLSFSQFKDMNRELKLFEEQPLPVKLKMKGDYLYKNDKYISAIRVYEDTIDAAAGTNLGSQFAGSIYYNMGCTYAGLFQFAESVLYFQKAYETLHSGAALKSYLFASYLEKGRKHYDALVESLKVDEQTKRWMDVQIAEAGKSRPAQDIDALLDVWTKGYHKNTGM